MPAAPKTTTLQYALLGLLAREARTGYGLRRVFETTPMGHYRGGQGAIYPALRGLEARGFVRSRAERERPGRGARLLSITPTGRSTLREWLRQPITVEDATWRADELALRLAFMDGLVTAGEMRSFLDGYRVAMAETLADLLRYSGAEGRNLPQCARLALDLGVAQYTANVEWATRARAEAF